jgi:hypothetical protein
MQMIARRDEGLIACLTQARGGGRLATAYPLITETDRQSSGAAAHCRCPRRRDAGPAAPPRVVGLRLLSERGYSSTRSAAVFISIDCGRHAKGPRQPSGTGPCRLQQF